MYRTGYLNANVCGYFSRCEYAIGPGSGSDVKVSLTAANGYSDWTMYLQRYTNGRWKTIGTRTGYIKRGSDSHRTFTNVKKTQSSMRVRVTFHGYKGGCVGKSVNTGMFIHA